MYHYIYSFIYPVLYKVKRIANFYNLYNEIHIIYIFAKKNTQDTLMLQS